MDDHPTLQHLRHLVNRLATVYTADDEGPGNETARAQEWSPDEAVQPVTSATQTAIAAPRGLGAPQSLGARQSLTPSTPMPPRHGSPDA